MRSRVASLLVVVVLGSWAGFAHREAAGAPPSTSAQPSASAPSWSGEAKQAVAKLRGRLEDDGAQLGAAVVDLDTGGMIASAGEGTALNPASNAKLATAVTALELLGAEHRFVTGLYGQIEGSKVARLVLRSAGDPGFGTAHLGALVAELEDAGVTEVGAVLVDQSYFDDRYVPPAFEQQPDEWAAFRAPVAAVSIDRNTVTFTVRPGEKAGEPASVAVRPPGFVTVTGEVKTGKKASPERVGLSLSAKGDRLEARVSGTIPEGSRSAVYTRRVDDPRKLAGYALLEILRQQGIAAPKDVALGGSEEKRALALHRSAPVGELVHLLGKDSDNFTAEMLFRAAGAKASNDPTPEAAVKAVEGVLRSRNAFGSGEKVVNGSGLFDANRATARSIATLLDSAIDDPRLGPELLASLAISGVDGTLRSRLKPLRDKRSVRAKTGTLAKSVALSGYILDANGKPRIAFSFLAQTTPGKTTPARDAIDEAVVRLARSLD